MSVKKLRTKKGVYLDNSCHLSAFCTKETAVTCHTICYAHSLKLLQATEPLFYFWRVPGNTQCVCVCLLKVVCARGRVHADVRLLIMLTFVFIGISENRQK